MLPLSLAAFLALITAGESYQCYICSWSPKDVNRTDNCTDENFDPHNVPSDSCELGCEVYAVWDRNGALDQWRRNCLQKGTNLTGDCVREDDKASARQRCTCAFDYCNTAAADGSKSSLVLLLTLAALAPTFMTRA